MSIGGQGGHSEVVYGVALLVISFVVSEVWSSLIVEVQDVNDELLIVEVLDVNDELFFLINISLSSG